MRNEMVPALVIWQPSIEIYAFDIGALASFSEMLELDETSVARVTSELLSHNGTRHKLIFATICLATSAMAHVHGGASKLLAM